MSVLERCPSYRESNRGDKERQGPALGVRYTEVSVKRESTVLYMGQDWGSVFFPPTWFRTTGKSRVTHEREKHPLHFQNGNRKTHWNTIMAWKVNRGVISDRCPRLLHNSSSMNLFSFCSQLYVLFSHFRPCDVPQDNGLFQMLSYPRMHLKEFIIDEKTNLLFIT